MGDMVKIWLKRDGISVPALGAASPTWIQVLPPDPTRYLLMLPSNPTYTLSWWIGNGPPTAAANNLPAGASGLIFTDEVHGAFVTYALWLAAGQINTGYNVTSMSYNPNSFMIYQEMMREFLSKHATP